MINFQKNQSNTILKYDWSLSVGGRGGCSRLDNRLRRQKEQLGSLLLILTAENSSKKILQMNLISDKKNVNRNCVCARARHVPLACK